MFPGGDAALLKYIGEHTNYPEVAKENNIQGRVNREVLCNCQRWRKPGKYSEEC